MNTKLHFSSKTDMWSTPQDFFDKVNAEFNFELDVCATAENAKCKDYYTVESDALNQAWGNRVCWMNPPYDRINMPKFLKKAYEESIKGSVVVGLIPAKTETRAFHEYVVGKAEIRFIKGRLAFGDSLNNAPFPSLLVIWRPI